MVTNAVQEGMAAALLAIKSKKLDVEKPFYPDGEHRDDGDRSIMSQLMKQLNWLKQRRLRKVLMLMERE